MVKKTLSLLLLIVLAGCSVDSDYHRGKIRRVGDEIYYTMDQYRVGPRGKYKMEGMRWYRVEVDGNVYDESFHAMVTVEGAYKGAI